MAGWVAAAYGVVQALASPVVARAVDRMGQARVTGPAIAVLGLVLLVACARARTPRWTLLAGVVAALVVLSGHRHLRRTSLPSWDSGPAGRTPAGLPVSPLR